MQDNTVMLFFPFSQRLLGVFFFQLLLSLSAADSNPVLITIPSPASSGHVVDSNFFGLSVELSFMDEYFGNDTSSIPQTMLNYISQIRSRIGSNPFRLRVGGNSADTSTYVPSQATPMVTLTNPNANFNNQPVNYGPMLWEVMKKVSDNVGGVDYLVALPLDSSDPNKTDSVIAGGAKGVLEDTLDALLIGNEPDLYTVHQQRPALKNYTVQDYIGEFTAASGELNSTSAGDLLSAPVVGGPTVCCDWDLATLLQQGFLSTFNEILKYVTLQHYPQNNCFGSYQYGIDYYLNHSEAIELAQWNIQGVGLISSNKTSNSPRMLMSEFNSASCGGIPNISDTFGVGSLWTIDYVLQMASVGYSGAYIHTRETGISYNIVALPSSGNANDSWTTNPTFYSLLVTPEILQSDNGSSIVDLNIGQENVNLAGYAVYDAQNSSMTRVALFNFGNSTIQYSLPKSLMANTTTNPNVKFLSASSVSEKYNISWGGDTFLGVGDGKAVTTPEGSSWAAPNQDLDCTQGCNLEVPGPSLAVIFMQYSENGVSRSMIVSRWTVLIAVAIYLSNRFEVL